MDTSGPHCSVAVAANGHIFTRNEMLERSHNQRLLGLLDELFDEAGLAPADLEVVCFTAGPGSFTGVRIAAAACQAIAEVADARVVTIGTDEALYLTAKAHTSKPVITSIPSRGTLYYLSGFEQDACQFPAQLCEEAPEWLATLQVRDAAWAGQRPDWLETDAVSAPEQDATRVEHVSAAALVEYACEALNDGSRAVAAELALPRYLEGDSPWQPRRQ